MVQNEGFQARQTSGAIGCCQSNCLIPKPTLGPGLPRPTVDRGMGPTHKGDWPPPMHLLKYEGGWGGVGSVESAAADAPNQKKSEGGRGRGTAPLETGQWTSERGRTG